MGANNNIAIISNSDFVMQDIKNMLVLLRDVDKVECIEYFDAEDKIKENVPNVIILHASDNDKNCIKLINKIRTNENSSKVPIILYTEVENADFIVEAFDNGVSDILSAPLRDYELIIRVIWAIQKNESNRIKEIQNRFLAKLDIVDSETGFYKEDFSVKFLETVIEHSRENNQNSCLMLIKAHSAVNLENDKEKFAKVLRSSVRLNDTIAIKDYDKYYIFLSKSKLNGVYSVYERLLSRLGPMTAISASVVEIKDELFDSLISVLDYSLNKAPKNGEISIVKEQDYVDMYDSEEELGIAQILHDKDTEEEDLVNEDLEKSISLEDDKVELGLKIMQEKIGNLDYEKEQALKDAIKEAKMEEIDTDKRNAILYKQAWAKKLTMVVEPILKKYAAKFQTRYSTLDANVSVSPYHSFLKLDKDDVKFNLEITYGGLKTINFKIAIYAAKSKLEEDAFDFEVMDFDRQKMDVILKTSTQEYENYLQND